MSALELNIDVGPRSSYLIAQSHEAIECDCAPDDDRNRDGGEITHPDSTSMRAWKSQLHESTPL